MVKIHVKSAEKSEFWLETPTSTPISDLSRDINIMYKNKQVLLGLVEQVEAMIQHPASPEATGKEGESQEARAQAEESQEARTLAEESQEARTPAEKSQEVGETTSFDKVSNLEPGNLDLIKGTVSRESRWVLLHIYINEKWG